MPNIKLPANDLYLGTIQIADTDGHLYQGGTEITATAEQINALSSSFVNAVLTTPQINDTSSDHQYVFAVNELAADRTVTLPLLTGADEFAFLAHTSTFTNKTLTTPVIASLYQDAGKTKLMTIPDTASDTLCAIAATQTLTNKTLTSPTITTLKITTGSGIYDAGGDEYLVFEEDTTPVNQVKIKSGNTGVNPIISGDGETNIGLTIMGNGTGNVNIADATTPTKLVDFELVGATAATKSTLTFNQTTNRTITFFDASDTVVGRATTDTLTNKTLTSATLTTPKIVTTGYIADAGGDEYLMFVEGSTPVTYIKITSGNTGVAPRVQGAGETNTDLQLLGTGTGNVIISDAADPTKYVYFELNGAQTGDQTQLIFSQTEDRAITFPDATTTLVGTDTTDTLSNKTLTTPKIVTTGHIDDAGGAAYLTFVESATPLNSIQITQGDTTVMPRVSAIGETNIGLSLMGKGTGKVTVVDAATPSKALNFELVGATASTTTTIVASQTGNVSITLPDATCTLVGKDTTDILSNKVLTAPQINDTSADHQYIFAVNELTADRTVTLPLLTGDDTFVFAGFTQTLTNKTLTAPVVSGLVLSDGHENLTIAVTNQTDSGATITIPDIGDSADTMVVADLAQTLTNKTLTSPAIAGGTLSGTFTGTYTQTVTSATVGNVEPFVMSSTLTGPGATGGRARFQLDSDVALGGWANALKSKTVFGASGRITGLASSMCAEMTLSAGCTQGTYAPLELELNMGASGVTGTQTSLIYASVNDAAATVFDDLGGIMSINGITIDTNHVVQASAVANIDSTHAMKIFINGTAYYIPLHTAANFGG